MTTRKILKTVQLTVFLIIAAVFPAISKEKTNTSMKLDFAFPKKVVENSRVELEKALTEKNDVKALRAVMDLSVASTLISNEKVVENLSLLDSIIPELEAPYKAIDYLIQANIYTQIYNSNRYQFDNRTVDAGMASQNPLFWDRKLFAEKIKTLTTLALSEKEAEEKRPLSEISTLISGLKDYSGFSVYDFIVYQAIDLRASFPENEIIPFYKSDDTASFKPIELIDELITLHSEPSEARNMAIIHKVQLLSPQEGAKFLWQEIQASKENPKVKDLVEYLYDNYMPNYYETPQEEESVSPISKKELYSFLTALKADYKRGSHSTDWIDDIIFSLTIPNVRLSYPSQVTPGKEFEVTLDSENLNEFYILLIDTKGQTLRDVTPLDLEKMTTVADCQKVVLKGEAPFEGKYTLKFKTPGPGEYAFIASSAPRVRDAITDSKKIYIHTLKSSSIDIISSRAILDRFQDSIPDKNFGCYVVDSSNGSPIEKATVTFKNFGSGVYDKSKNKTTDEPTDSKGFAASPYDRCMATANHRGSSASIDLYAEYQTKAKPTDYVKFFTDRQIYKPGERVSFLGIAYQIDPEKHEGELRRNEKVKISILNPNYQVADTLHCVSDESGRFFASFDLPEEGLLGTWQLATDNTLYPFDVAAYKTPNIFVSLQKAESPLDTIKFEGIVSTFSGMPLANTKVYFTVDFTPYRFFWWRSSNISSYNSSVITDELGRFEINLPTDNLDPKDFRGLFTITASATDEAGETAESPAVPFWLVNSYQIRISAPQKMEVASDTLTIKVEVLDGAGLPVVKTVAYSIFDAKGKIAMEGEFDSPLWKLPCQTLPSGRYKFNLKVKEEPESQTTFETVLYRSTDKKPPFETALWVPQTKYVVPNGQKTVEIKYGCSYTGQAILCCISNSSGTINTLWLKSNGGNETIKVETPNAKENTFITLIAYRDHQYYSQTVTAVPEVQTEKLEIKTLSFRNSIAPGDKEEWKFTLQFGGKPAKGYLYALLYDKAMDAIKDLEWNPTLCSFSYSSPIYFTGYSASTSGISYSKSGCRDISYWLPSLTFDTRGYSFYQNQVFYKSARKMAANSAFAEDSMLEAGIMMDYAAPEMATRAEMPEESSDMAAGLTSDAGADTAETDSSREYRPIEMPVAFFKPDLTTDDEGNVEINFTVPNFNTTWNFIMGAYTPELNSSLIRLETVASKRVMVSMNPPRFLRTGDNARILATVYNNSEETADIDIDFELFNPLNNEIIKRETLKGVSISAASNKVVGIDYDCADNLSVLGLRIYATSGNHTDGEQTVIPVLPSSQPIVESDPFYIPAATSEFEFKLPEFKESAAVTFTYCDNPVWEVVTALPPIVNPQSDALTAQICALYANCIGRGMMIKNPSVAEGLSLILKGEAGDSLLVSNLTKDQELKTVSLNNTPWVNDAQEETLRLSKLGTLLDETHGYETIEQIWNRISNLRNPDGGWSWCQGMRSSRWMTESVLINIGLLKQSGCLPELSNLELYVKQAIKFIEAEYVADYGKITGSKDYFYHGLLQYLYIKSFFPEVNSSVAFADIKKKAVNYIASNWKREPIFYKSTAAIMLWREGKKAAAQQIAESLRQFTSESKEKGVWFDNLDSSWKGAGKLLTTSRALMAFHEIEPESPIIDRIRQWMLIQKQAQDWQEGLWSIDAIDALLSTGSKWTGQYEKPAITVGDREIGFDKIAELTGQIKINITDFNTDGGDIRIERHSPTPAWGGVISQYIAPMEDVKADSIADLAINKEYWVINETEEGVQAVKTSTLKVGDKVRVSLIVDCGRDMDFVAITDERAACLEPADQLSGYTAIDGLWCYRETRNSSTNLFFDFLPRGRHIISYECRIVEEGEFSSGIATIQCMYSPLLTAHSAGEIINCK